MRAKKLFAAHYRYRRIGGIGPDDHWELLECASMAEAKRVAKGMIRSSDKHQFLCDVEPFNPEWHTWLKPASAE